MLTLGVSFHLPSICLSLFSWSSFYFVLRHLEPRRTAEWHCRLMTAIHATVISFLSAWATFAQGPNPFTDAGGPNTPLQVTTTIICLGYFIFDFAWCLYFQTEGLPMLLHHSLSILGFVWTLCAGKYGTELMATLCGSEVTNPLLQLRWFLRETGRYHTLLGEVVDLVFMSSFFLIRLGVGSVLLYTYFHQPTDFMGRVGALTIYLISWMFWVSIFQYAVHKYTKKYRAWRQRRRGQGDNQHTSSETDKLLDKADDVVEGRCDVGDVQSDGESDKVISSKNGSLGFHRQVNSQQNSVHHRSNGVHSLSEGASQQDTARHNGQIGGVLSNG